MRRNFSAFIGCGLMLFAMITASDAQPNCTNAAPPDYDKDRHSAGRCVETWTEDGQRWFMHACPATENSAGQLDWPTIFIPYCHQYVPNDGYADEAARVYIGKVEECGCSNRENYPYYTNALLLVGKNDKASIPLVDGGDVDWDACFGVREGPAPCTGWLH